MNSQSNTKKIAVLATAIFAAAMLAGPLLLNVDTVFAKKYKNWDDCRDDHSKKYCKNYFKHHHNDDNGNSASQGIGQSQSSRQNSQVVSGGDTVGSGNNINVQAQENTGNNALAQSGNGNGHGHGHGGNHASQGIGQSQSSSQNSQVVSGGDTVGSGNNISVQGQRNSGNNALGQQ